MTRPVVYCLTAVLALGCAVAGPVPDPAEPKSTLYSVAVEWTILDKQNNKGEPWRATPKLQVPEGCWSTSDAGVKTLLGKGESPATGNEAEMDEHGTT